MTEIRKKCWPELFRLVESGRKNAELRLADFGIKAGDTLVLEEWDPKTKKYTGRRIAKKVKSVVKIDVSKFHSMEEIKKNGLYLIELEGYMAGRRQETPSVAGRLHSSKEMI